MLQVGCRVTAIDFSERPTANTCQEDTDPPAQTLQTGLFRLMCIIYNLH